MAFNPRLDFDRLQRHLDALEEARREVNALDVPPLIERWLQRATEARGAHMSTRIEGNPMTEAEVREVFARPERGGDAAEIENLNYRDAVRFARQAADDPHADVDGGLIRALHFLVMRQIDRYGTAGQYRTEQNAVRRGRETIYLPPSPMQVPSLMDALVAWLRSQRGKVHPLVLAAVAHFEFVSIHPFDDGNGRTSRALTAYFAFRGAWSFRGFVTTEQVFGTDIEAYYRALQRTQGPRHSAQSLDLTDWVEWSLAGLLDRARHVLEETSLNELLRVADAGALEAEGINARAAIALEYVALFGELTSTDYAREARVSNATAVADLRALVVAGYLRRTGAGRATKYITGSREATLRT